MCREKMKNGARAGKGEIPIASMAVTACSEPGLPKRAMRGSTMHCTETTQPNTSLARCTRESEMLKKINTCEHKSASFS
jgi:hypothetical protein